GARRLRRRLDSLEGPPTRGRRLPYRTRELLLPRSRSEGGRENHFTADLRPGGEVRETRLRILLPSWEKLPRYSAANKGAASATRRTIRWDSAAAPSPVSIAFATETPSPRRGEGRL